MKRAAAMRPETVGDADATKRLVNHLVNRHLDKLNKTYERSVAWSLLYRAFYYDAVPFAERAHLPITKKAIDYARTPEATFRRELFDRLRQTRKFAVRLGEVRKDEGWYLPYGSTRSLLRGERRWEELTDTDFSYGLRQKGVDMRIGLDIASITLKRQASIIVLVSGDADFVPAAKLARREGIEFILDPMDRRVSPALFEHIDGLYSGLGRTASKQKDETT